MSTSRNTTTLQIPTEMLEQVQQLMAQLSTTDQQQPANSTQYVSQYEEFDEREECEEVPEQCEVKKVLGHRVTVNGDFEFKLQLCQKRQTWTQWTPDAQCDCAWLIAAYLKSRNLRTAYIFCRVSTKDQAASNCLSLDGQESAIRNVCEGYDRYKVVKISKSVYRKIPRELQAIGEAANAGDGLFVYRVDRLTRNLENFIFWLKELDERDVAIVSVLDTSAMVDGAPAEMGETALLDYRSKRLTFLEHVLNAEKESAILSRKAKEAIEHRKARGDEGLGCPAFGKRFEREKETDRLLLRDDPEAMKQVELANQIADELCLWTKNHSKTGFKMRLVKIAKALNQRGGRNRGRKWNDKSVLSMLRRF